MQFIAQKSKLGQALIQALQQLVPTDPKTRQAVLNIYKRIFSDHLKSHKQTTPNNIFISGLCYEDRQYPNADKKQFFECLVSKLTIKPSQTVFSNTSNFVKLEAIQSQQSTNKTRKTRQRSRNQPKISGQKQKRVKKAIK